MLDQVHFAVQYLATAGKSFLEQKADDSHTNVSFDMHKNQFETRVLNKDGLKLYLDLNDFALKWSTGSNIIYLNGKTHSEVISLLKVDSEAMGLEKPYEYNLHYDLPFTWNENHTFRSSDVKALSEIIRLRTLANEILHTFLSKNGLQSDIRVWPHHFDTGAFVPLEDGSGKSIGLGMAIPDPVVDDHYFYISGYIGHEGIDTSNFEALSIGEWKNRDFKGAILPASESSYEMAVQFFQEAFTTYKS